MVGLPSGRLNGGQDILAFEVRIVFQYLVECRSGTQQFKHVAYANPHTPNARPAAALLVVDRYPAQAIWSHDPIFTTSLDDEGIKRRAATYG
jgi:hypothetical protein